MQLFSIHFHTAVVTELPNQLDLWQLQVLRHHIYQPSNASDDANWTSPKMRKLPVTAQAWSVLSEISRALKTISFQLLPKRRINHTGGNQGNPHFVMTNTGGKC